MKSTSEIKERLENYRANLQIARRTKETQGAVTYITASIGELNWVLEK